VKKRSPRIFVLSGESGAGKTNLCIRTVALLQQAGAQVAGVVSPACVEGGRKTGIFVRDIRSGEQRRLAERRGRNGSTELGWRFDPAALEWGSEMLNAATPCHVLVVDELGPLEFKHNKGWPIAWEILNSRNFTVALIVIRPSLIQALKERLQDHNLEIIPVTSSVPTAESLSQSILLSVARENK
jgi:nucleoside-triphosphatase THEP1